MKKIILLILFVFGTFFAGGVFCGITYASHTNFKPYLKNLKKTIYSNWHPIKSENTKHTILLFKIGKDGSLLSLSVLQSSGSKEVDDCAIEAVKKSAPFEKLPEKFDGNSIAVEFTFDYHVLFKNSTDTSKDYNEINVKEQSSSDYKDYNLFKQEPVRYNF